MKSSRVEKRNNWRAYAVPLIVLTAWAGASTDGIGAGGQVKPGRAEQEVMQAEAERVRAAIARDTAALDRLLAEDLTYAHSTGSVDTKAQFIESIRSGTLKYISMEHSEQAARVFGNTAVLTGRSSVQVKSARSGGELQRFEIRFLTVYVKQDGRWRQVAWQSTRIPAQ